MLSKAGPDLAVKVHCT
jgi:hypothetical protein